MAASSPFQSFFMAGFECSSHRRRDGRRLDLLAATGHDRLAAEDYRLVSQHGLRTVRDGLRWHLIEARAGRYDWTSFLPMLRAARDAGVQVVWDLCHYGWPDDLSIWEPAFVDRFARFAAAAAKVVREETDAVPLYCPVNEISYWSWAGGEVGKFKPAARRRGAELKRQLVRASAAGVEAVRAVDPRARFVHVDPAINVVAGGMRDEAAATAYHGAQFEAWDMLAGRLEPELGGRPEHLDVVGLNYYSDNQWYLGGSTIPMGHHAYRPLREILADVHGRYGRPLVLAETGAEGSARAAWLFYVAAEVRAAVAAGVPVQGICLYPVVGYPGWENDRPCDVGLFGAPDPDGRREIHGELAEELRRQRELLAAADATARRPPHVRLVGRAG